jgi:hypothetical protein
MPEIESNSNQGIRRCPNCEKRENGVGVVCMHCYWVDGVLSRFTGECELRKWADELDLAGVLNGGKKLRDLADTIKSEREEINNMISEWQTGKIILKEDNDDIRGDVGQRRPTSEPAATPDTQCGC